MFTVIGWFVLSIFCGVYASSKGRSGFGFFLLAVLLSPIIGFIGALIASPVQSKVEEKAIGRGDLRKCPMCAELVKAEALLCKHCGSKLDSMDTDSDFSHQEEPGYQYQIMVNGEDIIAFDVSKAGTPDNIDRAKAKGFKERGVVFADNAIEAIKIYSES
ncbi:zinc ribbon domain-containing protein [Vibrio sp. B1Z05]|uniref:zinc ribbon domain-containing protein n=1 Tax=Vibrio sp. B1Z05 TaxID=2654980 RepID=UPI001C12B989|nr:zinc ribbon domain-containing protein [Vibrio sp. B1Z05]